MSSTFANDRVTILRVESDVRPKGIDVPGHFPRMKREDPSLHNKDFDVKGE